MELTSKDRMLSLLFNVSIGILGFWLIINPEFGVSFVKIYLGIILLVAGAALFYVYYKSTERNVVSLFQAIILAVIGVVFLISTAVTAIFLGIILMVWVFIEGVLSIRLSIAYSKLKLNGWWIFLIYGLAAVGLGFYLLFNLTLSGHALVIIVGAFTLARSIFAIIDLMAYKKYYVKKDEKEEKEEK